MVVAGYILAAAVAAVTGFVVCRLSINLLGDLWRFCFPNDKIEVTTPADDLGIGSGIKDAGSIISALISMGWCVVALLCSSPLWAVIGSVAGGLIGPVLVLAVIILVVLVLVLLLLLNAALEGFAAFCHWSGGRIDAGYARLKRTRPAA